MSTSTVISLIDGATNQYIRYLNTVAPSNGTDMADADKTINITEFKNKWQEVLTTQDTSGVEDIQLHEYLSKNTSIPPEILSELETVCG